MLSRGEVGVGQPCSITHRMCRYYVGKGLSDLRCATFSYGCISSYVLANHRQERGEPDEKALIPRTETLLSHQIVVFARAVENVKWRKGK